MGVAEVDRIFSSLKVWVRGEQRAPHKPLLAVLALGRLANGIEKVPYVDCEDELSALLRDFGPDRSALHPEYPFWRLQNDGLWVVKSDFPLAKNTSSTDPPRTRLRSSHAVGSFTEDILGSLRNSPATIARIAKEILTRHFPESLHAEILERVGLSLGGSAARNSRDPAFRRRVLTAYEYRCAMCGLDIRFGDRSIGLEAAHIRWHQNGGPATENNGIALCSIHHKLFDLGAFTLGPDHAILISEQVHGTGQFDQILLRHHGKTIFKPNKSAYLPAPQHIAWHKTWVFKGSPRDK